MSKQAEEELSTDPAQVILVYSDNKKKEIRIINQDEIETAETKPFLYLGDSDAALISHLNKNKHITHILNVTKELKLPNLAHLTTLQIPIQDEVGCDIGKHFPSIVEFIRNCLKEKGCVLVHCYSGISRSSSMVAAFLMNYFRMEVDESLLYIRSRRKVICPNPGFVTALNDYEKLLKSAPQDDNQDNSKQNETKNCTVQ